MLNYFSLWPWNCMFIKTIKIDPEKSGDEQGITLTFTVSRNMRLSDLWCTFRVSETQSKGMESWEGRESNNAYK